MAIQFTDFSSKPILESPFKNMLEDVLKGYKMGAEPAKMKQESSARELANKLKGLEVEHKPKEYELNDQGKSLANSLKSKALEHYDEKFGLEKQLKQAQIQKALQKNVGGSPKANGELANFMVSHPGASEDEIRKAYEEIHGSKLAHEQAVTNRSVDMTSGSSFDKLPTNDKKREIGLMTAMGVDPVEAASMLRKGTSASEYAKQQGIDISEVTPKYALGEQNIKDVQRTAAYFDELGSLEKNISAGMSEYPNRLKGYSLDQIADQLAGDKPEKVGRALASAALQPELAALRLKVQGGNIGIEAIRELTDKSLGNLKTVESLVDKPTYLAMQKYINQWLREAGQIRIKSLEGYGKLKGALNKGNSGMGSDPLGLR